MVALRSAGVETKLGLNRKRRVLLCYAQNDDRLIGRLTQWLNQTDRYGWFSITLPHPEQERADPPDTELPMYDCAIVWVGREGLSARQNDWLSGVLARQGSDNRAIQLIAVLIADTATENLRLLADLPAARRVIVDGLPEEDALHRLIAAIDDEPAIIPPPLVDGDRGPFPGLRPFDSTEAALFFGRETETEQLVAMVRTASSAASGRCIGILGSSGMGKSSLVRAGLLAALESDATPGSSSWTTVICSPGSEPLKRLARSLLESTLGNVSPEAFQNLTEWLGSDVRTLHTFAQHILQSAPADRRLLVFIDQFEELYTCCDDERERQALIDTLLHAASAPAGRVIVVIALRTDADGNIASEGHVAQALTGNQLILRTLSAEGLRRAIEGPAARAQLKLEPGLIEALLSDSDQLPHQLPRLQHTLQELWRRADAQILTLSDYGAIGGVCGGLTYSTKQIYYSLDASEQAICRRLLTDLIASGELVSMRRRVRIRTFLAAHDQPALAEQLVGRLIGPPISFLKALDDEYCDDGPLLDLSYDAVAIAWEEVLARAERAKSAEAPHHLLVDAPLDESQQLFAMRAYDLALALVDDSLRSLRKLQQPYSRFVLPFIGLALLVGALGVAWEISAQANHRNHVRFLVNYGQTIVEERPLLGLRLLIEGLVVTDEAELRAQATQVLREISVKGRLLKISGDAERVYPLNDNSTFILQRRDGAGEIYRTTTAFPIVLRASVRNVYFNPDTPFYLIAFEEGGGELRRTDSDNVVPFAGNPEQTFFRLQDPFFVARYANKLSDLEQAAIDMPMLRDLTHDSGEYLFDPDTQRLVAVYESGSVILLDVAWLLAVGDDPEERTTRELISIACHGPLSSTLWTAYDQQDFERLLGGQEQRGCS